MKELRNCLITAHPHFVRRWMGRKLELDKVKETIRTGNIIYRRGNKFIIERYFGKENETYCVVCFVYGGILEVKTSWKKEGR